MWADEPRVSSHNCLSQFLSSSGLCLPSRGKLSSMLLPSTSLICLKRYEDKKNYSLCIPLRLSLFSSLRSLSDFLDPFVLLSASHPRPPSLSSLCGRVVINPYFIAGEFLSQGWQLPTFWDTARTIPNPPSITPSLPPSGPDYGERRKGGGRHHTITPWEREREKGRRDGGNGYEGEERGWRGGGRTPEGIKEKIGMLEEEQKETQGRQLSCFLAWNKRWRNSKDILYFLTFDLISDWSTSGSVWIRSPLCWDSSKLLLKGLVIKWTRFSIKVIKHI